MDAETRGIGADKVDSWPRLPVPERSGSISNIQYDIINGARIGNNFSVGTRQIMPRTLSPEELPSQHEGSCSAVTQSTLSPEQSTQRLISLLTRTSQYRHSRIGRRLRGFGVAAQAYRNGTVACCDPPLDATVGLAGKPRPTRQKNRSFASVSEPDRRLVP
jgi:hypothetical protein